VKVKAETTKALLRAPWIHAIDSFLAFDFEMREWGRIARALHGAGDMAEIFSHKDGEERYDHERSCL
jgi:hypothetical protein